MKRINVKQGDKYGYLTIVKEQGKFGKERAFVCKCRCGNTKRYALNLLRNGTTRSCGCYLSELNRSPEKRLKQSLSTRGPKSVEWKGDKAGIIAKHLYITKNFNHTNKCSNPNCKRISSRGAKLPNKTQLHLANISKKHYRTTDDYIELCGSCHKRWDLGLIKIDAKKIVKKRALLRIEYKNK